MVEVVARERPAAATSSEGSEASSLRRRYHILLIGILLAGALLLRVSGINQPSVEQRETQSALLARGWYLGDASGLPAWKQGVLHELRASVKPIEPPILDYITSLEFRLTGENFWFPRLLSSLLWVLGGVFLYLIASRLTTRAGALIALALYLTWPYAVWLSRHFMPDAMMVSGLLAAALTVIRYWEQPSPRRLIVAGAVSCLATAIKPGVAFLFLVALFASLAVSRRQLVASLARGRLPLFALLTAAAAVGYYVWGTYFSDFISPTADVARVTPDFVVTSQFWKGWWEMVSYLLRYPQPQELLALVPISAGLAGIALARGTARAVLVGLSLGYVAIRAHVLDLHTHESLLLASADPDPLPCDRRARRFGPPAGTDRRSSRTLRARRDRCRNRSPQEPFSADRDAHPPDDRRLSSYRPDHGSHDPRDDRRQRAGDSGDLLGLDRRPRLGSRRVPSHAARSREVRFPGRGRCGPTRDGARVAALRPRPSRSSQDEPLCDLRPSRALRPEAAPCAPA